MTPRQLAFMRRDHLVEHVRERDRPTPPQSVVALCAPHMDRLLAGEKLGRIE